MILVFQAEEARAACVGLQTRLNAITEEVGALQEATLRKVEPPVFSVAAPHSDEAQQGRAYEDSSSEGVPDSLVLAMAELNGDGCDDISDISLVNMGVNHLNCFHVLPLLRRHATTLLRLDISYNALGDTGMHALSSLLPNLSNLKMLDLSDNGDFVR